MRRSLVNEAKEEVEDGNGTELTPEESYEGEYDDSWSQPQLAAV